MKKGRVALRNKLIRTINNWEQLGAKVEGLPPPIPGTAHKRMEVKKNFLWRFVRGVAKDGRLIIIYPILSRMECVPLEVCKYMNEFETRGAIVGCAETIGDAWCIVSDDPKEYKRFKKTYHHQYWLNRHMKGKRNGKTEEE